MGIQKSSFSLFFSPIIFLGINFMKLRNIYAIATAIFSIILQTPPAFAQAANDSYVTKEEALKAAGFDPETAHENDQIIFTANANESKLKEELGSAYGGIWIEYDENNRAKLVVAITKNTQIRKSNKLIKDAKIVYVKYSEQQFNALQEEILGSIFKLRDSENNILIHSININPKKNTLEIFALQKNFEKIISLLKRKAIDMDMVTLMPEEAAPHSVGVAHKQNLESA